MVINTRLRYFKKHVLRLVFSLSFFFADSASDFFCEGKEKQKTVFRHLTSYFAVLTQMSPPTFKIFAVIALKFMSVL